MNPNTDDQHPSLTRPEIPLESKGGITPETDAEQLAEEAAEKMTIIIDYGPMVLHENKPLSGRALVVERRKEIILSAINKAVEPWRQTARANADWDAMFCDELVKVGIASKCNKHDKNCISHIIPEIVHKLHEAPAEVARLRKALEQIANLSMEPIVSSNQTNQVLSIATVVKNWIDMARGIARRALKGEGT